MNQANHHKIVVLAVSALPACSRSFWEPLRPVIEATCMLPDHMAIPLLNGETGPWRQYFPTAVPKHSFEKHGASARAHFFDVRFYVEQVLSALLRGDLSEACRFLGVFSHCLGDFSEPAHYCEQEITLLVPPPPDRVNCNSHRMIEDTPSTIIEHVYRTQPLGTTAETMVMRLEGRLRELYELAMGTVVPMLGAIYTRDLAAASAFADRVMAATVEVMGDMLHTCWCIHCDGWTVEERHAMDSCRLDTLEPAAYDVEFNYGFRPLRGSITLDRTGIAMPLRLAIVDGAATTERVVEGLCVVPHALPIKGTEYTATLDYDLPPNAFTAFTAVAGLLAGVQPQAVCRFLVQGDGRTLFESPPVGPGSVAMAIAADVSGVNRLRLAVHTDGSTDKLAFPIWAWPTVAGQAG